MTPDKTPTPNQQIRHRDPIAAAMPDLVARDGTVVRVENGWVVVRWCGAVGESRVPLSDLIGEQLKENLG